MSLSFQPASLPPSLSAFLLLFLHLSSTPSPPHPSCTLPVLSVTLHCPSLRGVPLRGRGTAPRWGLTRRSSVHCNCVLRRDCGSPGSFLQTGHLLPSDHRCPTMTRHSHWAPHQSQPRQVPCPGASALRPRNQPALGISCSYQSLHSDSCLSIHHPSSFSEY